MTSIIVHNLLAYGAQTGALIIAGAVLLFALKLDPVARLRCLHLLLACCILLPVIQPWRVEPAGGSVGVSTTTLRFATQTPPAPSHWIPSLTDVAVAIIAAGVLVRLALLVIGFFRLGRYLEGARFVPDAFPLEKQRTGAWPDVFISENLTGPVTFGFFRPVVLIPTRWRHSGAIACHELLHVRRRDWAFTVFEETFHALLWFHPGVWWLIGQIQLAREEAVDRAAIQLTHSREQYLKTLLEIAEARAGFDLAPATLFLKKRHLRQRVAALLQEVNMSKIRIRLSFAGFLALVAVTGWLVTRSFPLQAAPQSVKDSMGVSVQQDETKLLHRAPVRYPKEALDKGIQGSVIVQATLNDKGEVSDAQVISGPQELRRAALESVLQWHYNREVQSSSQVQVSIDFGLPSGTQARRPSGVVREGPEGVQTIRRIDLSGVPQPLRGKVAARLPVSEGNPANSGTVQQVLSTLSEIDEHLQPTLLPSQDGSGVVLSIRLATAPDAQLLSSTPTRIRVGGNVQATNLVTKVTPLYPPEAKQARIQGTVRFTAYIAKDGHIENLELVSGHPLLVQAAQEAVKQWVYRPTLLNGEPVEVVTAIDVNFTLSQ